MQTSHLRLARELGTPGAHYGLELWRNSERWHSLGLRTDVVDTGGVSGVGGVHKKGATALDIDRQTGRYLLAAGATGAVSLHDLSAGGAPPQTAAAAEGGHKFTASSICFYPSDADLFISGSFDGTVRAWDTRELSVAHTFRISRAVHAIAMAPRARHTLIAVAAAAAAVRLLDLGSGAAAQELIGHVGAACYAVAWSTRDENLLASGGVDGQVRLWDVRMARACLVSLDCEGAGRGNVDRRNRAHDGVVNGLTWSEDGTSLVSLGHDDKLRVWDLSTGSNVPTDFSPVIRNRQLSNCDPVLTCLRHSDPQLVFVPSVGEILGFHFTEGNVVLRQEVTQHKVSALVQRPHHPAELYYGSTGGEIGMLAPPLDQDGGGGEDDGGDDGSSAAGGKDKAVLDAIYQSLVRAPMTFT